MVDALQPGTSGTGRPDEEWLDELTAHLGVLYEQAEQLQERALALQHEAKALQSLVAEARVRRNHVRGLRTSMRRGLGLD